MVKIAKTKNELSSRSPTMASSPPLPEFSSSKSNVSVPPSNASYRGDCEHSVGSVCLGSEKSRELEHVEARDVLVVNSTEGKRSSRFGVSNDVEKSLF